MGTTAAILYKKDGYNTSDRRLVGRQSAGEGFLKGLVQYGTADELYCYTGTQEEFAEFVGLIDPWAKRPRQVRWVSSSNPKMLAEAGTLYIPVPGVGSFAWSRRFTDQRAYSICGVTHTIATKNVMQAIGDLPIAPVQPWDALICTSQAVKIAVEEILGNWADYLAKRTGSSKIKPEIQLPVIPLGVDCDAFPQGDKARNIRAQFRQQFGIASDDIVVLFMGRLTFSSKAHPVPMYMALETAAKATNKKIHLIQAGWFENQKEENSFKGTAQAFCPSVNTIFIDGRLQETRFNIWCIADIFISLSDNIQETFGLTPIEAMAAGLPVIVSDWNGYQESVRHQVDGLKIPTLQPPPDAGIDLAESLMDDSLNYDTYIGHTSMMTAVDIDACSQALTLLINDAELRRRLGENGRSRVRELYDWKVVISAYEQLWQNLAEIRAAASMSVPLTPNSPPYPLCEDPFRLFAHYSTTKLTPDLVLCLGRMAKPESLQEIRKIWITSFGRNRRSSSEIIDAILARIKADGEMSVGDILNQWGDNNPTQLAYLSRSLVYLLKFDVLRLSPNSLNQGTHIIGSILT